MKATTSTTNASSTTNTKTSTITTTSTTTGTTLSQVSTSPRDLYPSHVPVVCQQTTTGITRKLVFLPPFFNVGWTSISLFYNMWPGFTARVEVLFVLARTASPSKRWIWILTSFLHTASWIRDERQFSLCDNDRKLSWASCLVQSSVPKFQGEVHIVNFP